MTLDTQNFIQDVIEKSYSKPVLVDFWAEWCGPCKVLGPVLEKLAKKYNGLFELVKLNTDHFPEIASQYRVRGIPNVKLFINGEVVNEFTGAVPEPQVDDWIKKNIPGKNDKIISRIKELIKEGKEPEAVKLLNELKKESADKEIDLLSSRIYLFSNPEKALQLAGENESADLEIESVRVIADLLIRLKKNELPAGDVRDEYISSIENLKQKDFSKALEGFINIIRKDRSYDDDGARKACIAIFKFLGEEHPVTTAYRRDFGSALYV